MKVAAPEQLKGGYAYRQTKLLAYCLKDEVVIEKSSTKPMILKESQETTNRVKHLKHLSVSCMPSVG